MLNVKTLSELAKDNTLNGKKVFIRSDLNVPLDGSCKISDDTRIRASLPAIEMALKAGAAVMVTSHLGRPEEGKLTDEDSLQPVADRLSELLGKEVKLQKDWLNGVSVNPGEVVLLENCRGNVGEKKDDEALSKKMAALCDVYVNDAFGTAHRAQATTHGIAKYAKVACAGPLMQAELEALEKALANARRPLVAIVAGSKVSTKLTVLKSLSDKVDQLIVGGGIANTFMLAEGHKIGKSLAEPDQVDEAKQVMDTMKKRGAEVPIPEDVVCGKEFKEDTPAETKAIDQVVDDDMIFDVGPKTSERFAEILKNAGTIVWNGPVGVFEFASFAKGTEALAKAIAESDAFSIAGGGDTLAAIAKFGITDQISYISTGGGAFLEFLEGKELPAVKILKQRSQS